MLFRSQVTAQAVSVIATGTVLDAQAASATNANITAQALRLEVGGAGQSSNALELQVPLFSANVGSGGLFVRSVGDVTLGTTNAIAVQRVDLTAQSLQTLSDASQSGLTSVGQVVWNNANTAGSDITLAQAINAQSSVTLTTGGALTMAADLSATGGAWLKSGTDLSLTRISASAGDVGDSRCGRMFSSTPTRNT